MSEAAEITEDKLVTERARRFLEGETEHLKPLLDSVEKSKGLLGPDDVADHLEARVEELGLADSLAHFREHGYAVIEDVAPPEEMDELREAIHGLAEAPPVPGVGMRSAPFLLGRHPAVDRIATNPKILAFAEVSVGNGLRASQFAGSIMFKSDADLPGVHADQNWLPAPFPEHNCVITFCIPCEGMTDEGGATRVVPGSGVKRRHPTPEEVRSETVPIEVEKGGRGRLEWVRLARRRRAARRGNAHRAPRHLPAALYPTHRRLHVSARGRGIHGLGPGGHAGTVGREPVLRHRQARQHGRHAQVRRGDDSVQAVGIRGGQPNGGEHQTGKAP